eukprot:GAFH01002562.1.p2 GENE.GAFH01002562.1~~GAFH01002562.1.p2  ORF type:complete len:350 (+),score=127.08 GAFH01002562.1:33-1082(+)
MAYRPLVSIFNEADGSCVRQVAMPPVLLAPIRPDIVHFVHTNLAKNHRQAYAVSENAGMQHSAESWGTGRAVARIPRISGGGTHRSGQGAFGNQCRGGRMFAPTKTFRRWHRKVNINQRRYALCSALAAASVVPLVMARGHRIEKVPEIPLVVQDGVEAVTKTKDAMKVLKTLKADSEVEKVKESVAMRAGKGKMRNRRYVQRRGPLVIYNEDKGITRAFRNIPGVELCPVTRLNLLQLAPGGHLGRFVIWTEAAFKKLDQVFGTFKKDSLLKAGYRPPVAMMHNSDITSIINSEQVQSVLRPKKATNPAIRVRKNPLRNKAQMYKLNPMAKMMMKHRKAAKVAAARKH